MKVIIIGGVAGGASAAARLRRLSEEAEIIILERGEFVSFANCGLPYYIGGDITDSEALLLQTPESFRARFNIDVRNFSEAEAIDPAARTVTVKKTQTGEIYQESYDKLILAPGAAPLIPPIDGLEDERVFTLRNIPDTLKIKNFISTTSPESGDGDSCRSSAAVIGGGYIGIEMAENLTKAGLDVTVIEMADHVIASLDYDMACIVHNYLIKQGVKLKLGTAVKSVSEIDADLIILAAGVRPDTALAGAAGLSLSKSGAVVVNEKMQTSDENIYAVGDAVQVTEFVTGARRSIPLAGPANKQGRIAADNICGLDSAYKGTQGSAIIKIFDMTVAATGITEKQAAEAFPGGYDKVFTLSASNASYYPGGREMCIKTIFERETGKILGAQIAGYGGVDKRCDVLAAAVRSGLTASDLAELELCYAPPFSSAKDPVNFAGYVIENTVSGLIRNFHWHDVSALPRDGSVTLLDVRTPGEYAAGNIDGFVNMEIDTLRENINRLDKSKPVYVHCRSGVRSYLACRILTQRGFDCYNLSGGFWLYNQIPR